MGDGQSRVARLGLAAGPCDGLAGMPAARGPATLGTVRGGGPPAGGRVPVQAVRDVPRGACGHIRLHLLGAQGQGEALSPRRPAPGGRGGYPWQDLSGPLPQLPAVPAMRLRPRIPPGWPWEPACGQDLACRATALRWQGGAGHVTWVELALDCETFLGWALPASPHHQLRGMRVPLGERAQVLRHAARLLQRHMATGRFLQGAPSYRCRAIVPLGGRLCAGARARPFFAAKADMILQFQGLALHLQGAWLHRLRTPARIGRRGGGGGRHVSSWPIPPAPQGGGPDCSPTLAGSGRSTSRGSPGRKRSARGGRARAEGRWGPAARNMARPRAPAACSWVGE